MMLAFFYLSKLCRFIYIKYIIVLEIYVTRDVISSYLVLSFLHYIGF